MLKHLIAGLRGEREETPKPGSPVFENVENRIIATARRSLEAAALARAGTRPEEAPGRQRQLRDFFRARRPGGHRSHAHERKRLPRDFDRIADVWNVRTRPLSRCLAIAGLGYALHWRMRRNGASRVCSPASC